MPTLFIYFFKFLLRFPICNLLIYLSAVLALLIVRPYVRLPVFLFITNKISFVSQSTYLVLSPLDRASLRPSACFFTYYLRDLLIRHLACLVIGSLHPLYVRAYGFQFPFFAVCIGIIRVVPLHTACKRAYICSKIAHNPRKENPKINLSVFIFSLIS